MDFGFSEDQEAIRDTARRFLMMRIEREATEIIGSVAMANCPCGSTMTLATTDLDADGISPGYGAASLKPSRTLTKRRHRIKPLIPNPA